ncbi:hypothetical protein L1887_48073 [Cichorium endivia]|nr:hypothetical protein L1887_48073 [Cichorium endivia]
MMTSATAAVPRGLGRGPSRDEGRNASAEVARHAGARDAEGERWWWEVAMAKHEELGERSRETSGCRGQGCRLRMETPVCSGDDESRRGPRIRDASRDGGRRERRCLERCGRDKEIGKAWGEDRRTPCATLRLEDGCQPLVREEAEPAG